MVGFPPEFVLFDLEYTACEESKGRGWSGPGEHREIIQIGAIRVAAADLSEKDSFLEYVRPIKSPKLSDFIVGLTGITQADIAEKGLSYEEALERFKTFVGGTPAYCWGSDIEVFEENSTINNMPELISREQFKNLRPVLGPTFAGVGIDIAQYSSGTLIQAFGNEPERRAHDAVNDMRNLLDALRLLAERADMSTLAL